MLSASRSAELKPVRELRKSQLSPNCQRLVQLLGHVYFGRVEQMHVRNGEPIFDPAPRITRTLKMNGRNTPLAAATAPDFALKSEVIELIEHLARLGNGIVQRVEIAHGLPLLAEIQDIVSV